MSTQTNNAYVTKSMNGIISYDDGAGGVMEGGVITANQLIIDEIQSNSPPNVVSLFTDTTTIINMGSSTSVLNVSNLNVSNINLPSITFTTLNVSNANSSVSNSSTSNSSTSNSSTSNSSTSNSSTSNASTSNADIANNGTTNASTVNVSTLNFGTTSGTTINMSTVNASIVNVNEIQGLTPGDNITLYTNTIGNINIGDTTTNLTHLKGLNVLLESVGDTYVQTANDLYLSTLGNTTMNGSSLFIGSNVSYTIGNINIGNVSTNSLTIDSKNSFLSSVNNTTISSGGIIYLNSNGNTEICNGGYGGKLVLSGNQEIRAKDRSMPSYLFTDAFSGGDVYMGNASTNLYLSCPLSSSKSIKCIDLNASTLNVSTIANISTLNVSTANISTLNVSTLNASTTTFGIINNTTINTTTLNASTANISFLKTTNISSISSSATNNLYPDSTTGILNICPNYTNGAINIGNSGDVGSFSLSQGTININPKTTLNVANQIGTGNVNICNSNTFNGVLYIANTTPTSGANIISMGSTSTTINVNSFQTTITSSRDYTMNAGSGFNIRYNRAQIPVSIGYSANTGTNVNGSVGRIMVGTITRANGFAIVDNVDTEYGNITNLEVGVWVVYSKIGVLSAGAVTIQTQGSYITDSAGFVVSESKYMGTSAGSTPAGRIYWYENCATYSCFATTTLRVFLALDWGGGSNTASTANNRFTATRIA